MTDLPPVRLVRAANPSPLTGSGTNTWLIGGSDIAVIDPGPDLDSHLNAVLAAIGPGQRISTILATHAHLDHTALAPRLAAATGAEILAYGTATEGRSDVMARLAPSLPPHGEGLDLAFAPDRTLRDGDAVSGPDWSLRVIHTPGHLGGHLAFALDKTLFSGDHVMGWSTSIVSPPDGDMGAYMQSLARLSRNSWRRFLPGHGEPVETPAQRLAELTAHRLSREAQILAALSSGPERIRALTERIYSDIARDLLPAAERNVFAHLVDLSIRNLLEGIPTLHPDAQFVLR
ncbi:MAG TPA: MBL fold metallo-hydrolase [Tabrizicola sp.]|mgnify:CR=1 FL=1|nr:MBL fold metallo-hydrolase [Tabrizicola sp.]